MRRESQEVENVLNVQVKANGTPCLGASAAPEVGDGIQEYLARIPKEGLCDVYIQQIDRKTRIYECIRRGNRSTLMFTTV